MDISFIIKIFGIALLISLAVTIVSKTGREELAFMISIAGILLIFALLLTKISELVNTIRTLFGI